MHRRAFFSLSLVICCTIMLIGASAGLADNQIDITVRDLERQLNGRVGVFVRDHETGQTWGHRADERFPLSSTFKPFACAALLRQLDESEVTLDQTVPIREGDLVTYSPVTENHVGLDGMTLGDLCEATITLSDNTAGNLVLKEIGGPEALTDFLRGLGDRTSRLDRWETALNEGAPSDPRDTTSPAAISESLDTLLLGSTLSDTSKAQLEEWMRNDRVADALLRSVLPHNWQIADKTGAGGHGARSIIALVWPPNRKPLTIAIYLADNTASFEERNTAIAEIGRAIFNAVQNETPVTISP